MQLAPNVQCRAAHHWHMCTACMLYGSMLSRTYSTKWSPCRPASCSLWPNGYLITGAMPIQLSWSSWSRLTGLSLNGLSKMLHLVSHLDIHIQTRLCTWQCHGGLLCIWPWMLHADCVDQCLAFGVPLSPISPQEVEEIWRMCFLIGCFCHKLFALTTNLLLQEFCSSSA